MMVNIHKQLPAFRITDDVLQRLWTAIELTWPTARVERATFTVRETTTPQRGATRVVVSTDYRTVNELRSGVAPDTVLRNYSLFICSWSGAPRNVYLRAHGGSAAIIDITGPDAEWCHTVLQTIMDELEPYKLWHAPLHRLSIWTLLGAGAAAAAAIWTVSMLDLDAWTTALVITALLAFLVSFAGRDFFSPASDIRVGGPRPRPREVPRSRPPQARPSST